VGSRSTSKTPPLLFSVPGFLHPYLQNRFPKLARSRIPLAVSRGYRLVCRRSSFIIRRAVSIAESALEKETASFHAAVHSGPAPFSQASDSPPRFSPEIFGISGTPRTVPRNRMDFLSLVSSVSAVFPAIGQVDYARLTLSSILRSSVRDPPRFFQPTGAVWQKQSVGGRLSPVHPAAVIVPSWHPSESVTPETFSLEQTHWLVPTRFNPVSACPGHRYLELAPSRPSCATHSLRPWNRRFSLTMSLLGPSFASS